MLGLSLAALAGAFGYATWAAHRAHEANRPIPGPTAVVAALRAFHQQTGRFPVDFRELDTRLWRGAKRAQISSDGHGLTAPLAHYYYVLHTLNPPLGTTSPGPPKAGLWALPTGPRAPEAASYFLYLTPTATEVWMGPALTAENVSAVRGLPSEQQLVLLAMTQQTTDNRSRPADAPNLFSWLGF